MILGTCLFYEDVSPCELCCNNCVLYCENRCANYKNCCGGYFGSWQIWGRWEEQQLFLLRSKGHSWKQVGELMGRTESSCKLKWKRTFVNTNKHLS